MDDPYDVLDCALRSRYLAPTDLPTTPFWQLLPAELRSALAEALAGEGALAVIIPLVWQVRVRLLGRPNVDQERANEAVRLRLGLLYLAYREGRITADELLRFAFHVADSYVCDVDARPFTRLWHERQSGDSGAQSESRVASLFLPYTEQAEECVTRWGLRVREPKA